ncbi:hypothetical protein [Lactobacillus sp. PV012]|uniref:hypothetical protein n=1 Tax=Lactobacillus sp. PV012 TaxID=2594494 RepID=UPI00223F79AE|nr:hypothetical protein [Lactobacillus sp. PV012]QNQ82760.1 hypothetical protein FP433_06785 [Lactobacillus sp. PV012]
MHVDDHDNDVISCDRDGSQDYGVSKWAQADSSKLAKLVEQEFEAKNYDIYWEDVAIFKYPDQFNLTVHKVKPNDIVEIAGLDGRLFVNRKQKVLFSN